MKITNIYTTFGEFVSEQCSEVEKFVIAKWLNQFSNSNVGQITTHLYSMVNTDHEALCQHVPS